MTCSQSLSSGSSKMGITDYYCSKKTGKKGVTKIERKFLAAQNVGILSFSF
jgi:hypothetical protein